MSELPRLQLHDLLDFLHGCARAANAPPPRSGNALENLLTPSATSLLGGAAYDSNIADMLSGKKPPIEATEELPPDRRARIELLRVWLARYPAYRWLSRQSPVNQALQSFHRVQKRSRQNPRLSSDVAEFGFWKVAAMAALFSDMQHMPSADAAQRMSVAKAVATIRRVVRATRLLQDAGINWTEHEKFEKNLEQISIATGTAKRPRSDAHSADREYVEYLTSWYLREFSVASPSPIVALAGLEIASPNPVALTKQITAYARALANEPDTTL
jgi:hypothetical protein